MRSTAWVQWNDRTIYYVAQVRGDGGKDWGYTTDREQAIGLTPYWQRAFAADCRRCNREARFPEIEAASLQGAA